MKNKPEIRIASIDGKDPKQFFLDWEKKVLLQQKQQALKFSIPSKSIIDHYKRVCNRNLPHCYKCCQACPFKDMILKVVSRRDRDNPKIKITVD
ncbi:MAG: hypothetical protein Q8N90_00260 [bacterium]|nr:hypothetical protein [bacterium]